MARSRSAHHTIAGYHYQFDKSLIEILKAGTSETITLEGIEDIDLSAETIQCKYHASQKYVPSQVKAPLQAFLTHFSANRTSFTYTLYAHFNEGRLPTSFTVDEAKAILGTALVPLGLTDAELASFLQTRLRCVPANDLDEQRREALAVICSALNCTPQEAEDYFYGNALHEIIRLSRQPTLPARQITRQQFVTTINRKRRLFSHWLVQLKGESDYHQFVRAALSNHQALSTTKQKHFQIHAGLVLQSGVPGVVTLCRFLVERFFRVGHVLWDAVPPTVILDVEDDMLLKVKRELLAQQITVNDGFEHLGFQTWYFDLPPVTSRTVTRNGRPTDKIGNASYVIRLIGRKTYDQNKASLRPPHVCLVTGPDLYGNDSGAGETLHLHAVETHAALIAVLQ